MSALSGGRGLFSFMANAQAMSSLTIAFRYACSRKQFDNPQKTGEIPIIDYPITKVRLIPNLSKTIFHIAAGNYMARAYFKNSPTDTNPKYVAELHAVSASIKALIMESISLTIN
jgi:acyl-CoA oxidase